ncbi:MAG: hypothetical protein WD176_08030, partial [Pirellulales bacterium]
MRLSARLLRAAVILLAAYAIICGFMMFLEERFIFFPSRHPEGNWKPTSLKFEDAEFRAADGTKLHGWFVPHAAPRA